MRRYPACIVSVVGVALMTAGIASATSDSTDTANPAAAAAATPEADPAAKALRAARAFLRTLARPDDAAAYELTTPEYRAANTAEQFGKQVTALRDTVLLSPTPPLSGWVTIVPKAGEPRKAQFTTHAQIRLVLGGGGKTGPMGLSLVERNGRWLVDEVRSLTPRENSRFTIPIRKTAAKGEAKIRFITSSVRGVVTGLGEGSVTVKPRPAVRVKGKAPPDMPEQTLKVNDRTQVVIVAGSGMLLDNGDPAPGPGTRIGTVADLAAGNTVNIEVADEDGYADTIAVLPAPPDAAGPGL
jgi:hypothetical protein